MSAYGTYQSGQEQKKMGEYNASVMEGEANLIKAGAARENEIIRQNAVLQEYRARKQQAVDVGSMVGAFARSGVSVNTGSPLNYIADQIANSELSISIDKWNAENNVATNTYNSEVSALNKQSNAKLQRIYGTSAATNATYSAAGTLLSSASSYYGKTKIGA